MERAGRILTGHKSTASCVSPEAMACKVWKSAVGKRIAEHSKAIRLDHGTLIVEVEDAIWQRQLSTLKPQILRKVCELIGPSLVTSLEFRVMVPRRMPERVEAHAHKPAPLFDEADAIHDPFLRRIYRTARKKASA
jgi:hypothetical protein